MECETEPSLMFLFQPSLDGVISLSVGFVSHHTGYIIKDPNLIPRTGSINKVTQVLWTKYITRKSTEFLVIPTIEEILAFWLKTYRCKLEAKFDNKMRYFCWQFNQRKAINTLIRATRPQKALLQTRKDFSKYEYLGRLAWFCSISLQIK